MDETEQLEQMLEQITVAEATDSLRDAFIRTHKRPFRGVGDVHDFMKNSLVPALLKIGRALEATEEIVQEHDDVIRNAPPISEEDGEKLLSFLDAAVAAARPEEQEALSAQAEECREIILALLEDDDEDGDDDEAQDGSADPSEEPGEEPVNG